LAGYTAAHAVWSISDGSILIPILAYQARDGETEMGRLAAESVEQGVQAGMMWLEQNPEAVVRAVLIYDGYLDFDLGRMDAMFIEGRDYAAAGVTFRMAVPYRHAESKEGFAVYSPRFLSSGGEDLNAEEFVAAFFQGIAEHEQGSALWFGDDQSQARDFHRRRRT
jgi:hypothetical protein